MAEKQQQDAQDTEAGAETASQPAEKPVSLSPLGLEDALKGLLGSRGKREHGGQ